MKHIKIFSLTSEYETSKSGGTLITPNVSLINEDNSVRYLPEINSHIQYEYVDLGLSVKWATCNVGATSSEEYGLYFAWGETTGYTGEQVTSGVREFNEDEYNAGPAASIETDLTLEQDAAHAYMGGKWRMPTKAEFQELLDKCNGVWTNNYNGTGVKGRVFTSKLNGNSVFFPAVGSCSNLSVDNVGSNSYYWSASWRSDANAWPLYFDSGRQVLFTNTRYYGFSVRGVCE